MPKRTNFQLYHTHCTLHSAHYTVHRTLEDTNIYSSYTNLEESVQWREIGENLGGRTVITPSCLLQIHHHWFHNLCGPDIAILVMTP